MKYGVLQSPLYILLMLLLSNTSFGSNLDDAKTAFDEDDDEIIDNRLVDSDRLVKKTLSNKPSKIDSEITAKTLIVGRQTRNKTFRDFITKGSSIHKNVTARSFIAGTETNHDRNNNTDERDYIRNFRNYTVRSFIEHSHNGTKRTMIDDVVENSFPDIGKAYGDPDTYQKIGDGVYLMQSPDDRQIHSVNKDKIKTLTKPLPDTVNSLAAIIGHLNRQDKTIIDDDNKKNEALEKDEQQADIAQSKQRFSDTMAGANIEGVTGSEMNLLGDIQSSMNRDDNSTPDQVNREIDMESETKEYDSEKAEKGMEKIAKAVESDDKEFIRNNPYAIDPDKMHGATPQTGTTFKKDSLTSSEDISDPQDDSAHDVFSQGNAEIVVGGSRSRTKKPHKKHRNRHHRRYHKRHHKPKLHRYKKTEKAKPLPQDVEHVEQEEVRKVNDLKEELAKQSHESEEGEASKDEQPDTGFFIADENDISDLNKESESFVEKNANASVVRIIEPKTNHKKDNLTKVDNGNFLAQLDSITPGENVTLVVNATELARLKKQASRKTPQPQEPSLFKILNETAKRDDEILKRKHEEGKKKNVNVINVGGKPGVQIDLYISNRKTRNGAGNRELKLRTVRSKSTTPEKNVDLTGQKKFFEIEGENELDGGVEDVTLNEKVAKQDQHMFSIDDGSNEKLDINDHIEGNEGNKGSVLNIQDTINNEELKHAMEESDMKGISAIKNELALQDAKSTVDFFNTANTVKPAHGSISDISEEIKESENLATKSNEEPSSSEKAGLEEDPQKVKIILHIPESVSAKDRSANGDVTTQEALNLFTEQAKAFLSPDRGRKLVESTTTPKSSDDEATMITAKKIEAMLRENSRKDDEAAKQRIKLFQSVQKGINHADDEGTRFLKMLGGGKHSAEVVNSTHTITLNAYSTPPTEKQLDDLSSTTQMVHVVPSDHGTGGGGGTQTPINQMIQSPQVIDPISVVPDSKEDSSARPQTTQLMNEPAGNPSPPIQYPQLIVAPRVQYPSKDSTAQLVNPSPVVPNLSTPNAAATINFNAPGVSTPLKINGGKVIGGNVRGGNVLGGVISGGDVSGGEIQGGTIEGGTFKNGLMLDGVLHNGVVEGGKIKGGFIDGGDIKSGLIEGGVVKGGIIEGGRLINGSVEGGDFKGGVILGGHLVAGEMDGGVLKNGSINGGVMKGGVIESGVLEGGTMLSGTLRGGIVKSGVINGGIIDKGVVVQDDAEIGPGVEIHEGIVKGGKISVNTVPAAPSTSNADNSSFSPVFSNFHHGDENRSNVMYSIEVLPKPSDNQKLPMSKKVSVAPDVPITLNVGNTHRKSHEDKPAHKKHNDPEPLKAPNPTFRPKITNHPISSVTKPHTSQHTTQAKKTTKPSSTPRRSATAVKLTIKENTQQRQGINLMNRISDIKHLLSVLESTSKHSPAEVQQTFPYESKQEETRRKEEMARIATIEAQNKRNEQAMIPSPFAHWSLTQLNKGLIKGDPGPSLHSYGGVRIHNGHAILDGGNGYIDAGDYQGECFSDPEVCEQGFTIQMTVKVYRGSVFNKTRLFLVDSGATSPDSRGISVWVQDGRVGAMVTTRDDVWCLRKILEPYIEKWISFTLTWRKDKGLFLFINCDVFDKSEAHLMMDCDGCVNCHKTDRATRMFFGRPNKGPHFKVTHMSLGEVSLYETFSEKSDVQRICGAKDFKQEPTSTYPQPTFTNTQQQQISAPASLALEPALNAMLYSTSPMMAYQQTPSPPQQQQWTSNFHAPPPVTVESDTPLEVPASASQQFQESPSPAQFTDQNDEAPPGWPTIALHQEKKTSKKQHVAFNPWPTPANMIPAKKTTFTSLESNRQLVDFTADRRSLLVPGRPVHGGYSPWSAWSPCSQTCGEGVQSSVRYCTNPAPRYGGVGCERLGKDRKDRVCLSTFCPERKTTIPVMRLEYGTKKSDIWGSDQMVGSDPMFIVDGEQKSYDQLENAFKQLKHR